jgi:hypothetical protein
MPRHSWVRLSLLSMVVSFPLSFRVPLCSPCYPGPKEAAIGQITEFQKLFLFPGFLAYISVLILGSLVIIFYYAPKSVFLFVARCHSNSFLDKVWQDEYVVVYCGLQYDWRY